MKVELVGSDRLRFQASENEARIIVESLAQAHAGPYAPDIRNRLGSGSEPITRLAIRLLEMADEVDLER